MKPRIQVSRRWRCGGGGIWSVIALPLIVAGPVPTATAQLITPLLAKVSVTTDPGEAPCGGARAARVMLSVARTNPNPKRSAVGSMALQVGAFESASNAAALRARLGHHFQQVSVSPIETGGTRLYRVLVQGIDGPHALEVATATLRDNGFPSFRADLRPSIRSSN